MTEDPTAPAAANGHEDGKRRRRAALLAAARSSLVEGSFSMRRVAQLSGVSEVTPYNLFGSKGGLLTALYRELVADSEAAATGGAAGDPLRRMLDAIDRFGEGLRTQPDLYRGLFSERIASRDGRAFPNEPDEGIAFWHRRIDDLIAEGVVRPGPSAMLLRRHFVHLLAGSIQDWIDRRVDASQWRASITHGLALLIASLADDGPAAGALSRIIADSASELSPSPGARRR